MAIVYVSRDGRGRISGVFANAQHGYANEAIDDQTPEVRALLDPPDLSIHRRAGTARRARRFHRALDRDPISALVERARQENRP